MFNLYNLNNVFSPIIFDLSVNMYGGVKAIVMQVVLITIREMKRFVKSSKINFPSEISNHLRS